MAQSDYIRDILSCVPREPIDPFFAVSTSNQTVLRSLASTDATILPVYNMLLSPRVQATPSADDLRLLLRALVPLVNNDALADIASAAALNLLEEQDIRSLGSRSDYRDIRVFRVRSPEDGHVQFLSFEELIAQADRSSLFLRPPTVAKDIFESHLRTLGLALPNANPLIVEDELPRLTSSGNRAGFVDVINKSSKFGCVIAHRVEMIRLLRKLGGDGDACAFRRLCAGEGAAGDRIGGAWRAKLWK